MHVEPVKNCVKLGSNIVSITGRHTVSIFVESLLWGWSIHRDSISLSQATKSCVKHEVPCN
jgi:hypothetical protein